MAGRYQLRAVRAERGGVTTHEGVDPLTGLPVLVYRFSGQPRPGLRDLESENIPGLLGVDTSDAEDDKAEIVVAYFKEYQPVEKPLSVSPTTLLLDSVRALKDAAQAGVVHGDVCPARFLASRDHVLLEGFGVPWSVPESAYRAPEAEVGFAGDVFAWAKSVLELAKGRLDGATLSLLTSCLHADPLERPAASELYATLKRGTGETQESIGDETAGDETAGNQPTEAATLEGEQTSVKGGSFEEVEAVTFGGEAHDPADDVFGDAELAFPPEPVPEEPWTEPAYDFGTAVTSEESGASLEAESTQTGAVAIPSPPQPRGWDQLWDDPETGPELVLSDPGRYRATPETEAGDKPFVKNLPPGATYRPGETSTGLRPGVIQEYAFDVPTPVDPRRRRLVIMLALLIFGAAVLAYLALFWQQRQAALPPTAALSPEAVYVVDATLGPPDLPPTDVYVVSSPAGSRNPPGALITVVSPPGRQIALDRAGTWQLQARFQKRASEIVTFQVPQERAISFTLPQEPADATVQP